MQMQPNTPTHSHRNQEVNLQKGWAEQKAGEETGFGGQRQIGSIGTGKGGGRMWGSQVAEGWVEVHSA